MFASGTPSKRQEIIHVTQAAGSVLQAEALRVGDLKLLWHPAGTDCSVSHPGWYAQQVFVLLPCISQPF